jgi:hypothetical protein
MTARRAAGQAAPVEARTVEMRPALGVDQHGNVMPGGNRMAEAQQLASQAASRAAHLKLTENELPPGVTAKLEPDEDPLLYVDVPEGPKDQQGKPRGFKFMGRGGILHTYAPGEQNMRRSIAMSTYARANGVRILSEEPV